MINSVYILIQLYLQQAHSISFTYSLRCICDGEGVIGFGGLTRYFVGLTEICARSTDAILSTIDAAAMLDVLQQCNVVKLSMLSNCCAGI